jgi:hypothetical protein
MKRWNAALQAICIGLALSFLAALPALVSESSVTGVTMAAVNASDQQASARSLWEKTTSDANVLYTFLLTVFSGILALVSFLQLEGVRLTRESVRLTRESFVAAHRPRLAVRRIVGPVFDEQRVETVSVTLANVGDTSATITAFDGWIFRRAEEDEIVWEEPNPEPLDAPVILRGGERHTFVLKDRRPDFESALFREAVGEAHLVAWGEVRYRDELETERSMAFYRRYDRQKRRFELPENCAQEFQD